MFLNHIDLHVTDVQATVTFFETFFGFALETSRTSPAIAVLRGDHGVSLVLQRNAAATYPDGFHVGFLVEEVATVRAMHRALTEAGLEVSPVDSNGRGTMMYCRFDRLLVEVSCRRRSPAA